MQILNIDAETLPNATSVYVFARNVVGNDSKAVCDVGCQCLFSLLPGTIPSLKVNNFPVL